MKRGLAFLFAAFAPAAQAQFELFLVNGSVELQTPPVYNLGAATPGQPLTAAFRVRNTSTAPASLNVLALAGSGFQLPAPPALPRTLDPQAALDFTVRFQADAAGSYSAGLTLPGVSVILMATVLPALTWRVPALVDFGPVIRGRSAIRHFAVENRSALELVVPPLVVSGEGFGLDGPSPAGVSLQPQQSAGFDLRFTAPAAGPFAGTMVAGEQTFALVGSGIEPPLPAPLLTIDLAQTASARQGTVHVGLDGAALAAGTGTLKLEFSGADDPAVVFASGDRTLSFPIAPGDTKAIDAPFQTGTTAGTLVFTATLGGATVRQTVVIPPAAVEISDARASRTAAGVTVQLTGFDNTRTAGPLAFMFYDRAGGVIPPAPINATADFPAFFQTSGLGGVFQLSAVFPVNGDASQIAAFQVQLTNAAGSTTTVRTSF